MVLYRSYVIIRRLSVGQSSGNDVGQYQRDKAQAELTDGTGEGHRQSPTNHCLSLTLSVVTAWRKLQMGAAPLQWG